MTLQPFGPDIWLADGPTVVAAAGFHYPTRMAVIRMSSGGLFLWSPIALDDKLQAAVEELGDVRLIIAPNTLHHIHIADWQSAYPKAQTFAAPGLRGKRKDLAIDDDLGDAAAPEWTADIDQVLMHGNAIATEVVFFHKASGTVLFTDLIQQFPPDWFSGWRALVARLDLMVTREVTMPRKFRVAFRNRSVARDAARRIFSWPIQKIVMAHGTPVTENARAILARAFHWLKL